MRAYILTGQKGLWVLDYLKDLPDAGRRSSSIRAFITRSNMEVMHRATPLVGVLSAVALATTFLDVVFWRDRPNDILGAYRIQFALMVAGAVVFYIISARFVADRDQSRRWGNLCTALFVLFFIACNLWITLLDYAAMGRYFFLLVALIVLFGLFFIPPLVTLFMNALIFAVVVVVLQFMGLLAPVQVVTLVSYLVIITIVSATNYLTRVSIGLTNERITNASRHDELTGTLNRRAFDEDIKTYVGQELHLLLCDIDEFKYYNDLYGHATGDAILKLFAETTVAAFGSSRTYHFGGDEYIVVLPGMGDEEVRSRTDAWRQRFHEGEAAGRAFSATCSAGCVRGPVQTEEDMSDLLRVADMLLYRSKDSGRDRVTYAEYSDGLLREALTKSGTQDIPESNIDQLTGLMDLDYFVSHAAEIAPALLERGHSVAFLYINVANLKDYNARYGFARGDELLKCVAQVLRETFPGRMLSRFGDDRFVVMADDEGLAELLGQACDLVRERGGSTLVTLRTGVYRLDDPHDDIRHACDCARMACESLRGYYNVLYRHYTKELGESVRRYNRVLERFGAALENGYIQPYYQPIVRAASDLVCEFEVLARWVDPERGMLSPAEFVPALEEAHLIHLLDLHIVEEVCKNYRRIQEKGLTLCPVSINFSRVDFEACDLVHEVVGLLDRYGLPHELIHVELTESAFAEDTEGIKKTLDRFRAEGMEVWMDDFGSGYSALNILREYDFDLVKFDMSFVQGLGNMGDSDAGAIMLTNLVGMVKELGLQTLIEGVETLDQLFFLKGISFEKIQGFVFDRPNSFDDTVEKLRNWVFMTEEPHKRSYYDNVGKVNLMQPIDPGSAFDPLGLADGLPAAVLEYADGTVRYMENNPAYIKRLNALGVSGILESENLLNMPVEGDPRGVHAAIAAVRDTDDWVTVEQGEGATGMGYARCVARVPDSDTYAFIYFCLPEV